LNILKIPIYAVIIIPFSNSILLKIAAYRDFVFLGGGGGYEIENKIEVYQLEDPSQKILKKVVHEEPTGNRVPNFFELAHNVSITNSP
jgi:hypothetical protein